MAFLLRPVEVAMGAIYGDIHQQHVSAESDTNELAWPGLEGEFHPLLRAQTEADAEDLAMKPRVHFANAESSKKATAISAIRAGWVQVEERCGLLGRGPFSLAGNYSAGYARPAVQPFVVGVVGDQQLELGVLEVQPKYLLHISSV